MADAYFLSEVKKNMMVGKICDIVAKADQLITSHLLFFMPGVLPQQHLVMEKPAC